MARIAIQTDLPRRLTALAGGDRALDGMTTRPAMATRQRSSYRRLRPLSLQTTNRENRRLARVGRGVNRIVMEIAMGSEIRGRRRRPPPRDYGGRVWQAQECGKPIGYVVTCPREGRVIPVALLPRLNKAALRRAFSLARNPKMATHLRSPYCDLHLLGVDRIKAKIGSYRLIPVDVFGETAIRDDGVVSAHFEECLFERPEIAGRIDKCLMFVGEIHEMADIHAIHLDGRFLSNPSSIPLYILMRKRWAKWQTLFYGRFPEGVIPRRVSDAHKKSGSPEKPAIPAPASKRDRKARTLTAA